MDGLQLRLFLSILGEKPWPWLTDLRDSMHINERDTSTIFTSHIYHFYRAQVKVIFSEASVILFTGGGVDHFLPGGVCCLVPCSFRGVSASKGGSSPLVLTSSGDHCSGRYTSYWNAFLSSLKLLLFQCICALYLFEIWTKLIPRKIMTEVKYFVVTM